MQQVNEQFQQRFNLGRGVLSVVNGDDVVDVSLLHLQDTTRKTQFITFLQGLAESLQEMYLFRI